MKATGIVRRIDDLGRIVIPKEIRRTLRIREGDPLEIFVDRDGEVILKKYSPIGELSSFAKEYAQSLYDAIGHVVCVADRDSIIAVSGYAKKDLLNRGIGKMVDQAMEDRRTVVHLQTIVSDNKNGVVKTTGTEEPMVFAGAIIAPIVAQGDPIGSVLILSKSEDDTLGEMEQKMAETGAGFLAKQMEQ